MIKESTAFGIGVAVGVAAVVVAYGCYRYYKSTHTTKEDEYDKEFEKKLNQESKARSNTEELLSRQEYIDTLTAKDITEWFKNNKASVGENAKMVITKPTESVLKDLEYASDDSLDPEKSILQLFYDTDKNEALKARLITFENIEPNLEAKIIENKGMIVFTD